MLSLYVRDLIQMAQRDYEVNQCPYAENFLSQVKFLLQQLGGLLVHDLTFEAIEDYKLERIKQGRARETINKELNGLAKGFKIAVGAKLVLPANVPMISRLRRGRPRAGFLYIADFRRVCEELQPDPRDVADFAYWSGWRLGEILELTWDFLNEEWAWCHSKNGDIKLAPLQGHLREIMKRRHLKKHAGCPWVFHRGGKQIKRMRDGWNAAVRRAGLDGRVFHDMRRSFCRNAIRLGIDRDTVKRLSGHRSAAVFSRYNIQDEHDLVKAAKRLGEM